MSTENNKLIAEFMGLEITGENETTVMVLKDGFNQQTKYSTDWNWLMAVVRNCYDIEVPDDCNLIGEITCELTNTDIGGTYEACVKIIKWYNENKEQ